VLRSAAKEVDGKDKDVDKDDIGAVEDEDEDDRKEEEAEIIGISRTVFHLGRIVCEIMAKSVVAVR